MNTDFPGHADVVELEKQFRAALQPSVLAVCDRMDRSSPNFDAVLSGGPLQGEPDRYGSTVCVCDLR